jgi:hypothetical protein
VAEPVDETTPAPARPAALRPRVPERRPQPVAAPPPRPQVTTRLARPERTGAPPRPRALRISAAGWFLAAAAGGAGVVAALADGDALRAKLTAEATAADPDLAADAISDGVTATTALVLGGVALLGVALVVWTLVLLRRRGWARWPLLVTGALVLVADDVAQSVVSGGADLDRTAFVMQAVLVVVAAVGLCWRSTGRWLRVGRD